MDVRRPTEFARVGQPAAYLRPLAVGYLAHAACCCRFSCWLVLSPPAACHASLAATPSHRCRPFGLRSTPAEQHVQQLARSSVPSCAHLLVEHGLSLATIAGLLAVVTPLACGRRRRRQSGMSSGGGGDSRLSAATAHRLVAGHCRMPHSAMPPTAAPPQQQQQQRRTLRVERRLASLVLSDLVHGVLAALLALAEGLLGLRDVHLRAGGSGGERACQRRLPWRPPGAAQPLRRRCCPGWAPRRGPRPPARASPWSMPERRGPRSPSRTNCPLRRANWGKSKGGGGRGGRP